MAVVRTARILSVSCPTTDVYYILQYWISSQPQWRLKWSLHWATTIITTGGKSSSTFYTNTHLCVIHCGMLPWLRNIIGSNPPSRLLKVYNTLVWFRENYYLSTGRSILMYICNATLKFAVGDCRFPEWWSDFLRTSRDPQNRSLLASLLINVNTQWYIQNWERAPLFRLM